MAKIKLTKNELKTQKDSLKRFERYLPTLILKKQQLQMVVRQVESEIRVKGQELDAMRADLDRWIAVFGEPVDIESLVAVGEIVTSTGNIAGVDIPVFESLSFETVEYDLFSTPLWVDQAIIWLERILRLDAELEILRRQRDRLGDELRVTTQRVNLFEKVKIPETRDHIRRIRIYLGDEQTAAVVRGKIAKRGLTGEESE
jgi:V/A-type H+/Na+-transporting ATPase subunit D